MPVIGSKSNQSTFGRDTQASRSRHLDWVILVGVIIGWTGILVLATQRYSPPPIDAASFTEDEDQFSMLRVARNWETLVGDEIPHPAGSKQNQIVRQRLIEQLESIGYSVKRQIGNVEISQAMRDRKRTDLDSVELHNLWVVCEGRSKTKKAIAVTSHFDSTPFGPGAADDAASVALSIEIARLLKRQKPRERDVIFLFTDGEEMGLLGAKLLMRNSEINQRLGLVINMEARGTSGPSMMFETSPYSRKLIPYLARLSNRKFASSLFREIYKRLPNDTDFSVYRKFGKLGFNFAFIGDVKKYHTPADKISNVDPQSVYHQATSVLHLLNSLGSTNDLDSIIDIDRKDWMAVANKDEAVYFDLMGLGLIWWPANYSIWIGVIAITLIGFGNRRRQATGFAFNKWLKVSLIYLLSFGAIFACGYALNYLTKLVDIFNHPWPNNPVPLALVYWFSGLACASGLMIPMSTSRQAFGPVAIGGWTVLAVLSSLYVPGASHLFLVPILVAGFL
ncbi:MAG: M20/M25/M40 family metallo-hydrolase, partial [Planctomycetota bacterium]